ncbi:hypothetical protein [Paraburkholderia sp. GAS334]|uniref:hypothetical protein n=1 Tax=Paraburkholderia sp. GAS334 TaxID=3035131 RepID=UPI003D2506E2
MPNASACEIAAFRGHTDNPRILKFVVREPLNTGNTSEGILKGYAWSRTLYVVVGVMLAQGGVLTAVSAAVGWVMIRDR